MEADLSLDPHGYFVYVLWGRDGKPVYVGKSTNILTRLGHHMNTDKRQLTKRVQLIRCIDTRNMNATEAGLIDQYQPPLNKVGTAHYRAHCPRRRPYKQGGIKW